METVEFPVLFLREILDMFLGRPALSNWSVADLVTPQLCIEHFVGFHIHNLKSSQSWAGHGWIFSPQLPNSWKKLQKSKFMIVHC
jgi:hypothetical protein